MLVSQILLRASRLHPDKPALEFGGRELRYRELAGRSRRSANALLGALGLSPGDRFALLLPNRPEILELVFAAALSGTIAVPINARLAAPEVVRILQQADARVLLAAEGLRPLVDAARLAGFPGRIVWVGESMAGEREDSWERILEQAAEACEPRGSEQDPVCILYTSGTTGEPKGAVFSHRAMVASTFSQLSEGTARHSDVHLAVIPLHSSTGLGRLLTTAHAGGTTHILPRFDAGLVADKLRSGQITTALMVPTMLRDLLDGPVEPGRLRLLMYGAAPMPSKVLERALARLRCEFYQGYGQTESRTLTALRPVDHVLMGTPEQTARLGSVGRDVLGMEVGVLGEDGRPVAVGERGEIVARGDSLMSGYWQDPAATADAMRNGWLRTGDVGYLDEERYLFLVDRLKDTLKCGGFSVFPAEIERVLQAHARVVEAAVVAKPHARLGEVPVAFVRAREGDAALFEELQAFCTARLASYKIPRELRFVDDLPRNATGKVLRRQLREFVRQPAPSPACAGQWAASDVLELPD